SLPPSLSLSLSLSSPPSLAASLAGLGQTAEGILSSALSLSVAFSLSSLPHTLFLIVLCSRSLSLSLPLSFLLSSALSLSVSLVFLDFVFELFYAPILSAHASF